MKKAIILLLVVFVGISCKTSNHIIVKKRQAIKTGIEQPDFDEKLISSDFEINTAYTNSVESEDAKVMSIVDYAKQFNGVKYKFGGATADGMDCSGLVFESFRAFNILLPRSSRDMARKGEKISLSNTQEGDLLFFKTSNRRNDINHVGLVVNSEPGKIEFIHATLSAGVTVSKLSENYWNSAFVEARRIL